MVIDHAASLTFSFGGILRRSSPPLLNEGHATLLFFIRYRRRLHPGWTLTILEQSLVFYHFIGILVVSHEEGVVLLFLQASVALVVGLAHE